MARGKARNASAEALYLTSLGTRSHRISAPWRYIVYLSVHVSTMQEGWLGGSKRTIRLRFLPGVISTCPILDCSRVFLHRI